jgi:hypothetical protein
MQLPPSCARSDPSHKSQGKTVRLSSHFDRRPSPPALLTKLQRITVFSMAATSKSLQIVRVMLAPRGRLLTATQPGRSSLPLGESITFDKVLAPGGAVTFRSSSVNLQPDLSAAGDNTGVNLVSAENDMLLHVSVRRKENAIVLNARLDAASWGTEERVPLAGAFEQKTATITALVQDASFVVLIDGIVVHTFAKRISKDVRGISYRANSGSAFADNIDITVTTA